MKLNRKARNAQRWAKQMGILRDIHKELAEKKEVKRQAEREVLGV